MAYFSPYIDNTGLHVPSYNDILDNLLEYYKSIFGEDIYLDEDTMDYQQLSILSKALYESFLSLQLAYSSRSPVSASGVSLDTLAPLFSIYRINGTKSHVNLTITGVSGTVISNGIVADNNDVEWLLPAEVIIPDSGSISVDCESKEFGAFYSIAGSITTIITPTFGWRSVTNNAASFPGTDVETDSAYRNRMINSSFSPSLSVLQGILSDLQQINNVVRCKVYENDTNVTDSNGIPAHAISAVVDGGETATIAEVLYLKKAPGVSTYGTTSYVYTTKFGNDATINFFRPTETNIYVNINVKKFSTYSLDMEDAIKDKIVEYISQLSIGDSVLNTMLYAVALSAQESLTSPSYSVVSLKTSTNGATYTTDDISIPFNGASKIEKANISISYEV